MSVDVASNLGEMMNRVVLDMLHVSVIGFCIVAFVIQIRVLAKSRFLLNMTWCWSFMGLSYFGHIFVLIAMYVLASKLNAAPEIVSERIKHISSMWTLMDSSLSLLSSYCLIRAWKLITTIPDDTLDKVWVVFTQAIMTGLLTLVIAAVLDKTGTLAFMVSIFDVIVGTVAAFLVGHAILVFKEPPYREISPRILTGIKRVTFVSFSLWGLFQLPWLVVAMVDRAWIKSALIDAVVANPGGLYFTLLMVLKFICAMCAIIFGIIHLPDKMKFKHGTSRDYIDPLTGRPGNPEEEESPAAV
jgi:hypothetical protein